MLKRLLSLAAIGASAAAVAILPSSAVATGHWDCPGPWHSWGLCVSGTFTNGYIHWNAFSSAGSPYYVFIQVNEVNTTWTQEYGPMTGVGDFHANVPVGYASVSFNNYHSTNNGSQLYTLFVN